VTVTEDILPEIDQNAPPVFSLSGLVESLVADATRRYESRQTGNPLGVLTGIGRLNTALGGSLEPGLHCLHAPPGAGKTAFALQMSAECQCPALFVTCEVSSNELLRRHTARKTDTFLGKFKSGEMHPDDVRRKVVDAASQTPNLSIMDATKNAAPAGVLEEEILRLRGASPFFLLVIDSLHAWARRSIPGAIAPTEYEALNFGLAALGALAAKQNMPILYIAERNRGAMKGGQSAGAGTRVIEYAAETIIELDNMSKTADPSGWKTLDVILSKNRHGEVDAKIPLEWNGALQKFRLNESAF
jgi:replicative DNA helicase